MRLAGIGDNCVDYYVDFQKGYAGGQPVNAAVYTVRHGYDAAYIGLVGTDSFGDLIRDHLTKKGVDCRYLRSCEGYTAVSCYRMNGNDRMSIGGDRGVRPLYRPTDEEIEFCANAEWIHTSIWALMEEYLPRLRAKGALISYDFAEEFDSPKIDIAMPYIDYVQFGGKADTFYTRDFMKDVFSKGKGTTKAVVYTLGPDGSLVYDGKTFYKESAVPVKVVDTMGAGDTYMSGFMNAICDGKPIQEAMKTGALWASETLQYFGPH